VLRQDKWYGANSPDMNPVDYQIWGSCRSMCITAGIEELEHFHQVFVDEMIR